MIPKNLFTQSMMTNNKPARLLVVFFSVLALFSTLSGCQSTFQLIPKTDENYTLSTAELNKLIANNNAGVNKKFNVAIGCDGLFACNLASIDETLLINDRTNKPYRKAIEKGMLYVTPVKKTAQQQANQASPIKYFALTHAGRHSVIVRLFPISDYAYESVMVIHDFKANHIYSVHGFRKNLNHDGSSLLELAAPKPVCAVLLENGKPVREFCKLADVTTGLGEFKEESVSYQKPENNSMQKFMREMNQGIKKLIKQQ